MSLKLAQALCLDLDDTVRRSASGQKFIQGPEDVALFPDVEETLWKYRDAGWIILGISNAGGVAWGIKTVDEVREELSATRSLFSRDPFLSIEQCYHHEGGKVKPYTYRSLMRKPDIGMLALLEVDAWNRGYVIDWDNSLMVGDRPEDRLCAANARIPFQWAWQFFGRPNPEEIAPPPLMGEPPFLGDMDLEVTGL